MSSPNNSVTQSPSFKLATRSKHFFPKNLRSQNSTPKDMPMGLKLRPIKVPENDPKRYFYQDQVKNLNTPHKYGSVKSRLDSRRPTNSSRRSSLASEIVGAGNLVVTSHKTQRQDQPLSLKKLSPSKPTYKPIRSRVSIVKIPERSMNGINFSEIEPLYKTDIWGDKIMRFPQRNTQFRLGNSFDECVLKTE